MKQLCFDKHSYLMKKVKKQRTQVLRKRIQFSFTVSSYRSQIGTLYAFSSAYRQIPNIKKASRVCENKKRFLPVQCVFRVCLLNNVTNSFPHRGNSSLPPRLFTWFASQIHVFSRPVEAQPKRQKSLEIPEVSCKIDLSHGFRYLRLASTLDFVEV